MSEKSKTSTFTIHHDRCNPAKWTAKDVLVFAHFVEFGDMASAAALSRLGVQLVLSDHHTPTGGTLEHIGWSHPNECPEVADLSEICEEDITEVMPVYRGQTQYAVQVGISYDGVDVDDYEIELFNTRAEAEDFLENLPAISTVLADRHEEVTA